MKRRENMRTVLFAAAAAAVLTMLPTGRADAAPFCAYSGGVRGGYESCGYYTFEQCLATVRGLGGFCMRNPHDPALWGLAPPPPHRPYKYRRYAY
jgi:hypothetical protein